MVLEIPMPLEQYTKMLEGMNEQLDNRGDCVVIHKDGTHRVRQDFRETMQLRYWEDKQLCVLRIGPSFESMKGNFDGIGFPGSSWDVTDQMKQAKLI